MFNAQFTSFQTPRQLAGMGASNQRKRHGEDGMGELYKREIFFLPVSFYSVAPAIL